MRSKGYYMLKIAVAIYILSNGLIAIFTDYGGEFGTFVRFIFGENDFSYTFLIFIAISAFMAVIILLLSVFNIQFPVMDRMLLFYGFGWLSFIIAMDIIYPILIKVDILAHLKNFAAHIMVQGTIFSVLKQSKKEK